MVDGQRGSDELLENPTELFAIGKIIESRYQEDAREAKTKSAMS